MKDRGASPSKRGTGSRGSRQAGGAAPAPIESRFRAVFENSQDAIGISRAGVHLFVNPAYLELFGFAPGTSLAGRPVLDLVAPGSRDLVEATILRRERGEPAPSNYETRGRRVDGTEFDMEVKVSRYQEDGEDRTLVILRDVTRRKSAERELAERGALVQQIMDTASVAIFLVDKAGRIVHANRRMAEMFGCPLQELVGSDYVDHVHPEEREAGRRKMLALLASEIPAVDLERLYWRKDGTEFWGHLAGRRFHDAQGRERGLIGVIADISDRRRVEQELRASEERLATILDNVGAFIFIKDTGYRYTYANRRVCELFGRSAGEILGSSDSAFFSPESVEEIMRSDRPVIERGETVTREEEHLAFPGKAARTYWTVKLPLRDATGAITGLCGISTDITALKRSEEALRHSEEKYRRLYNETPVLLQSIDRDGVLVEVNDYWLATMGYARNEVVGRKVVDFYTDASRAHALAAVQPAFFRDGFVKDVAYQFVKKSGEVLDVLLSATAERDAAGTVVRSLAVIVDVTDRKRVERELRESEERYRQLFEAESDAIFLIDNETGGILMANSAAQALYGYGREELLAKKNTDLSAEPSATRRVTEETPVVRENTVIIPLRYHRKADGTVFPVEITGRFFSYQGRPVHVAAIRDITERQRAEAALRESQARLDLALQSANMGTWRLEIAENRRYFDELTCRLLGIDAATFAGTAAEFLQAVHPEDRGQVTAAIARTVERDVPYEPTYRVVWPDGSVHWVSARGRLVRDEEGRPARVNGVLWDITERFLLEQEIVKVQKLESVGTLAGGIAHDFNNLLQGIFGFLSMARLTHDNKERSLAMLEQAEKALHQAVSLTSQLLTFSKGGAPVKKVVDLRALIENSVAFALSGSRNTCEIVVPADLRTVEADEGQIGQVLQNIVLNADQAMPLGGTIRVAVRNVPAAEIAPPAGLRGDLVEISISDRGIGIPAEHLARIFDPYFTTKEKGSGLGLASSYSIVKSHGGLLRVRSDVGAGATFSIYLPASGAPPEQAKGLAVPSAARKGRVLVMDDEEMIRQVASELLAALGHEVACAETGEIALEAYRAARDAGRSFDVVILDLTVRGGMGGLETLRRLVEIDPGVRAVVSSGYSDDAALTNYREQGFRAFLKKPYDVSDLRRTVDALLG